MSIANLFEPNKFTLHAHEMITVIPPPPGPIPTTISVNNINALAAGLNIQSAPLGQDINIGANGNVFLNATNNVGLFASNQINVNSVAGTSFSGPVNITGDVLQVGDFASTSGVGQQFRVNAVDIVFNPSNSIQGNGLVKFSNMADPVNPQDLATKSYVDGAIPSPGTSQSFTVNLSTPSGPLTATFKCYKDPQGVVHMTTEQLGPLLSTLGVNIESAFDIPVGFRPSSVEENQFIIPVTNNSSETTGKIVVRNDGSMTIKLSTGLPFTGANFWGVNRTTVSWD